MFHIYWSGTERLPAWCAATNVPSFPQLIGRRMTWWLVGIFPDCLFVIIFLIYSNGCHVPSKFELTFPDMLWHEHGWPFFRTRWKIEFNMQKTVDKVEMKTFEGKFEATNGISTRLHVSISLAFMFSELSAKTDPKTPDNEHRFSGSLTRAQSTAWKNFTTPCSAIDSESGRKRCRWHKHETLIASSQNKYTWPQHRTLNNAFPTLWPLQN